MQERITAGDSGAGRCAPEDGSEKAKRYQSRRHLFFGVGLAIQLGGLTAALGAGWSAAFRDWAFRLHPSPAGALFFYFLFFSLYFLALELPFQFYAGYVNEKRFGLSNLTLRGWLFETAKKQLLSFVIFLGLLEILYALIRSFPASWWLFAWAGWFAVTVLAGKFAHVVILPLFYKSARLEPGPLREKILSLLERNRFSVKDIFVVNLSKTTRKANAAFAGLGSTRRVLLADTLIADFTPEEIETVVAHELGHCRRHHLAKGVAFNTALSLGVFYLGYLALEKLARPLGFSGPGDIAAFPLLGLVSFFAGLALLPAGNAYSRRHERQADDFALAECPDRGSFVSALKKLGRLNLAVFSPHPAVEFFLYSHPSLSKRIRRAEAI
jgi:STE24 endopeptidase